MPKGFKNLREELARIEERKAKALEESGGDKDWTPVLWFKLPESAAGKTKDEVTSAMTAVIRPLEAGDDLTYALVHPVIIEGYPYPVDIVCRDQDNSGEACPGCEAQIKRAVKGFLNVIWRDAPDFPLDEETNKYNTKVDYESLPKSDKVAILSSGPTLFGRLDELDEDFTLTDHDFSITREGLKLNTKYKVKKIKKVALSADDKKLAENKHDLSHYVRVPEYDEWIERSKGNFSRSSDDNEETPSAPKNPLSAGRPENIFA